MTRKRLLPILLILALVLVLVLVGCDKSSFRACRVNFYDGDELVYSYAVKVGGDLDEIPDVPYKEGKTGVWSVTDFDEITTDINVYAIYSESQFTVRFFVENELLVTRKANRRTGLADIPVVPSKIGYRGQWSVTDFTKVNRDLDVYAVYTAEDSSVSFSVGGEIVSTSFVSTGADLTVIPAVPAHPNKNYSAKWVSGNADSTTDADFTNINGAVTVYAHYYLTIDTVGGDDESFDCEIGQEVEAPAVGRLLGYDFIGWYSDNNYVNKISFPVSFEENTTIYARWLSASGASSDFTFDNGVVTSFEGVGTEVVIPYKYKSGGVDVTVTGIANQAFMGLPITRVTLPSTIKNIGNEAFKNCTALTDLVFANGSYVETIGVEAFRGCTRLKSFEISQFTTAIGTSAFNNCSIISEYGNLGASQVTRIESMTFSGNVSAQEFVIPASVEYIGNYAFDSCGSAAFDFVDPSGIKTIGEGSFYGCRRLTGLVASGLTSVGEGAFSGCYSLTSVSMVSDNPLFYQFGTDVSANAYTVVYDTKTYYLPNALSSVTIVPNERTGQNAVGTIVTDALYNCVSVKNIIIADGIKLIKEGAFLANVAVSNEDLVVSFPNTLVEIGASAFVGRTDMKSVSLPINLEKIDDYAFYQLDKLATINVVENNALSTVGKYTFTDTKWYNDFSGVVYLGRVALGISEDYIASVGRSNLNESDFAGLYSIADYAFANNTRLSSVILPENILNVGEGAFANDSALKDITFSVSCSVGEGVLKGCYQLERITVGLSKTVEELFGTEFNSAMRKHTKEDTDYYISPVFNTLTLRADEKVAVDKGSYTGFATLESIVVSEGITSVMDGAFVDNIALTSVSLPASLTDIGYYEYYDAEFFEKTFDECLNDEVDSALFSFASDDSKSVGVFAGCGALTSVTIQGRSSLTTIYPKVFMDTALTNFVVPASVTSIGAFSFMNTSLTALTFQGGEEDLDIGFCAFAADITDSFNNYTLTLPNNLSRICAYAFANRTGITKVEFNEGLDSIGLYSFAETGMTKLTLPAGVKVNGQYSYEDVEIDPDTGEEVAVTVIVYAGAFTMSPIIELTLSSPIMADDLFGHDTSRLTAVKINGGEIIDGQFADYSAITSLELSNVTKIGEKAFYDCSGLVRITVPYTVTEIKDQAFAGCTGLRSFVFENTSEHASRLRTIGKYIFDGDDNLITTLFPSSVTSKEFVGVFNGCNSLTEANIPDSVETIGNEAFYNCCALTSIAIPESVTTIGDDAFNGCEHLEFENIKFDRLVSIGERAFAHCSLLHGVKAENITEIGDDAFVGCNAINEITIINKKVSDYVGVTALENIVTVNVSSVTESIVSGAFDGCTNLASVMFYTEEGLEDILTTLVGSNIYGGKIFVTSDGYAGLSDSILTQLGSVLFVNPTVITASYSYDEINFTATITAITDFSDEVLFLPAYVDKGGVRYTVTAIGEAALKENAFVTELIVPFTIEEIGGYAFQQCASLTTVRFEIGSKLRYIGTNAFYECTSLTDISLPDSLTTIGDRAFYGDSSLAVVDSTVYSRLSYVGKYAFAETESLTIIAFNNERVNSFHIDDYAFFGSRVEIIDFLDLDNTVYMGEYAFGECYYLDADIIADIEALDNFIIEDTTFDR